MGDIYRPGGHSISCYIFACKEGNNSVYHHAYNYTTVQQNIGNHISKNCDFKVNEGVDLTSS